MSTRSDCTVLLRLGLVALSVGVLALVWELFALQAPYTPVSIGTLAAPVAQLRATAITTGLIAMAASATLPHAVPPLPTWWLRGVCIAVGAMLVALAACAAANVMGIQLYDPQPSASLFVYARLVTEGVAGLFLLDLTRRALRSRADKSPSENP